MQLWRCNLQDFQALHLDFLFVGNEPFRLKRLGPAGIVLDIYPRRQGGGREGAPLLDRDSFRTYRCVTRPTKKHLALRSSNFVLGTLVLRPKAP